MTTELKCVLFAAIAFYFVWIYRLLKKKKLSLQYSLMWFFSGLVLLLLVIFIKPFESFMHFLGVAEAMNGLLAVFIFLILLMLMIITSVMSQLVTKNKVLTQNCALLEKRIRELERTIKDTEKS